jgi:hypothetical protein
LEKIMTMLALKTTKPERDAMYRATAYHECGKTAFYHFALADRSPQCGFDDPEDFTMTFADADVVPTLRNVADSVAWSAYPESLRVKLAKLITDAA